MSQSNYSSFVWTLYYCKYKVYFQSFISSYSDSRPGKRLLKSNRIVEINLRNCETYNGLTVRFIHGYFRRNYFYVCSESVATQKRSIQFQFYPVEKRLKKVFTYRYQICDFSIYVSITRQIYGP